MGLKCINKFPFISRIRIKIRPIMGLKLKKITIIELNIKLKSDL